MLVLCPFLSVLARVGKHSGLFHVILGCPATYVAIVALCSKPALSNGTFRGVGDVLYLL